MVCPVCVTTALVANAPAIAAAAAAAMGAKAASSAAGKAKAPPRAQQPPQQAKANLGRPAVQLLKAAQRKLVADDRS
jgi:hypothetical protein